MFQPVAGVCTWHYYLIEITQPLSSPFFLEIQVIVLQYTKLSNGLDKLETLN